jgi:HlyD family secretion protein
VNESNTHTPNAASKVRARNRARRWLPYLGGLILIALIIAGLWPQPVPVETSALTLGGLRSTVNEEAKTRIRQHFIISAPVAGQLRRIPFKEGAEIKAGQTVLAQIDPVAPALLDARARLLAESRRDAASANLEKARATREFAASELKRLQTLYTGKTISIQELESAQWRETSAARELTASESAFRQAETELTVFDPGHQNATNALTEIKAPINGRVLRVFEESARVVTPGMPLLQIGDPTDLEVVIEVLSRDGAAISPGAKVELEQWGGSGALQARVRLVEPAAFTKVSALGVEEQRVRIIADLLTPAAERPNLGDAFRVESRIIIWETNQVLKAPSGALFRRGQDWAAYVVESGQARLRTVQTGKTSDTEVQIIGGLKEGDPVILYPGDRIKDGQRVKRLKI